MASFGKRQTFGQRATVVAPPRILPAVADASTAVPMPSRWPVLTIMLCATLVAIFGLQQAYSLEPEHAFTFNLRARLALGGVDRYLVINEHEWWRVFTAPWLHGSVDHLIGNLITLAIAGTVLERRVGVCWLAAVYLVGGVAGSIGSMALNQATLISVGASGAIMALVTMVFALSFHAAYEKHARKLRQAALFVLIPAVVPTVAHGGSQMDVGAHFGGFVVGMFLSFVLLATWSENKPAAPERAASGIVALGCLALALFSFIQTCVHYPIYVARNAQVAPLSLFNDKDALERDALALSRRYPHDPVLRFALALIDLRGRHARDAEAQIRIGLAEDQILATEFPPIVKKRLQAMLATTLLAQGREDEARKAAQPLCGLKSPELTGTLDFLKQYKLCA